MFINFNKKILITLGLGVLAAIIMIGGTVAYFSDTESSTNNKFVAGKINLKINNQCSYNGAAQADCSWQEPKDLDNELFFNFLDVKPGDYGEDSVSLHVIDNDAWLCAQVNNLISDDNGCDDPESKIDTSCGAGQGELGENLFFTVWQDDNCDNILDTGEQVLVDNQPASEGLWPLADSTTGSYVPGDTTVCYGIKWDVPLSVSNIIQSDSLSGDIAFTAVQARHMDNFKCADLTTGGEPGGGSTACDDNNPCTSDYLEDGSCQHDEIVCPAGEVCDVTTGSCVIENSCTPSTEICDGIDNDCDGQIDEENAAGCSTYYYDGDNDTWGVADSSKCLCTPAGDYTATQAGDCNDDNSNMNPGLAEACDGIDNNCNGLIDEGNAIGCSNYYYDSDGDGYGFSHDYECLCNATGYYSATQGGDCDEHRSDINPGEEEVCNDEIDNDCDGSIDEGC